MTDDFQDIRELCADCIKLTKADIEKAPEFAYSSDSRRLIIYKENAIYWLNDDKNINTLSFRWCCEVLRMNHITIRNGILKGGKGYQVRPRKEINLKRLWNEST